jgi:hypothetical protein
MKKSFRVDKKFAEIGFKKIAENEHGAIYSRENKKHKFTQVLSIQYKSSGKHIVQSYDEALVDESGVGNTCVGLTMYEMVLCLKKMKCMGWKCCK